VVPNNSTSPPSSASRISFGQFLRREKKREREKPGADKKQTSAGPRAFWDIASLSVQHHPSRLLQLPPPYSVSARPKAQILKPFTARSPQIVNTLTDCPFLHTTAGLTRGGLAVPSPPPALNRARSIKLVDRLFAPLHYYFVLEPLTDAHSRFLPTSAFHFPRFFFRPKRPFLSRTPSIGRQLIDIETDVTDRVSLSLLFLLTPLLYPRTTRPTVRQKIRPLPEPCALQRTDEAAISLITRTEYGLSSYSSRKQYTASSCRRACWTVSFVILL
jgi:hypothetical protein